MGGSGYVPHDGTLGLELVAASDVLARCRCGTPMTLMTGGGGVGLGCSRDDGEAGGSSPAAGEGMKVGADESSAPSDKEEVGGLNASTPLSRDIFEESFNADVGLMRPPSSSSSSLSDQEVVGPIAAGEGGDDNDVEVGGKVEVEVEVEENGGGGGGLAVTKDSKNKKGWSILGGLVRRGGSKSSSVALLPTAGLRAAPPPPMPLLRQGPIPWQSTTGAGSSLGLVPATIAAPTTDPPTTPTRQRRAAARGRFRHQDGGLVHVRRAGQQ